MATLEHERSLDGFSMSRLDRFGAHNDRWMKGTKRDARPTWRICLGIASALGAKWRYAGAEDVFNEIATSREAFKGMSYLKIGTRGAVLKKSTATVGAGKDNGNIHLIRKIVVVLGVLLGVVAYIVLVERRVAAAIQNRIGPNRVGWQGLLQPLADVLKLVMKEDIVPIPADRFVHDLAPIISIGVAMTTFAVIPFGDHIMLFGHDIKLQIADVNIGILFILALTSLGVYGVTLSGWSSNNKYSLLGGMRSSAQMISYELAMGLSVIGVIMIAGSLQLDKIVVAQAGWKWNIVLQPLGFITFVVAAFAETNRLPFDLPEAEPELVGGYHTEYSGLKFGLFFLAEYANMVTSGAIITTLYLGGWQLPFIHSFGLSDLAVCLLQVLGFCGKVALLILFFIIIRWTIPRFRYDQLMNIGWKVMLPLALLNIFLTALFLLVSYNMMIANYEQGKARSV